MFEVYIYLFLPSMEARRALKNLSLMPYAKHRAKHLGFQYYYIFTMTTVFFIMLMSTVIVSIKNPEQYVCQENSTAVGCVDREPPSALYITGLDPSDPMFTTIYTLVVAWIFVLSSAYLPPDSYGFKVRCKGFSHEFAGFLFTLVLYIVVWNCAVAVGRSCPMRELGETVMLCL